MTTQRLHDLLEELVTSVTPVDGVDAAWERAARTRRRRRLAAVAGTTVAVLALGAALLNRPDPSSSPPVTTPSSTPTASTPSPTTDSPVPSSPPDTTYAGAGVWWSPRLADEADLPWLDGDSPLPREIDLADGAPDAAGLERAVAAFSIFGLESGALRRVVLLAPDGSTRSLDTSRLRPVHDAAGNVGLPWTDKSLAPDGRHLFFVQNSALELYEPATGVWRTIETSDWLAEGARWLDADTVWVPAALNGTMDGWTYGVDGRRISSGTLEEAKTVILGDDALVLSPAKTGAAASAQSQMLAGPVEPVPAGNVSNPEAVVVRKGRQLFALALNSAGRAPLRSKGCCPVVGLLDADTVVFESEFRLLAWRVGSHDVHRVTEVTGWTLGEEGYVASWASIWR